MVRKEIKPNGANLVSENRLLVMKKKEKAVTQTKESCKRQKRRKEHGKEREEERQRGETERKREHFHQQDWGVPSMSVQQGMS